MTTDAASFVDEVDGLRYGAEDAGPLAWNDRTINMYSLAVRIAGELDIPIAWRSENEQRKAA